MRLDITLKNIHDAEISEIKAKTKMEENLLKKC